MSVFNQPLAREITAALAFKAAALLALYVLFFAPSDRPAESSPASAILGPPHIQATDVQATDGQATDVQATDRGTR
jgi:hypothetical protein